MKDLGVKRKDLYSYAVCEPCGTKDYDNEITYPELYLRGKQLEAIGLPKDLTIGGEYEITLKVKVRSAEIGDSARLTLDVIAAGDWSKATDTEEEDGEEDDSESEDTEITKLNLIKGTIGVK